MRLHPEDNVAIVVNEQGVAEGGQFPDGLVTREAIPQSRKVTRVDTPVARCCATAL
ncbi:Galactarate dehydratase (L-threo-forming) [compost metagenome]